MTRENDIFCKKCKNASFGHLENQLRDIAGSEISNDDVADTAAMS